MLLAALLCAMWPVGTCSNDTHTPLHVLVVTLGRSGSTLLAEMLAAFPNTHAILEPYYNWRTTRTGQPPAPSYHTLFTCAAFASAEQSNAVLNPYTCNYANLIPAFNRTQRASFLVRCQTQNITATDAVALHAACSRASTVLVKTIRFDRFNNLTALSPQHTRIVYLLRNPWEMFKSRFGLLCAFVCIYIFMQTVAQGTRRYGTRNTPSWGEPMPQQRCCSMLPWTAVKSSPLTIN